MSHACWQRAPRLPAETLGRLWRMLSHGQRSLLNRSRLASSLAVSPRRVSVASPTSTARRMGPRPIWSSKGGAGRLRDRDQALYDSASLAGVPFRLGGPSPPEGLPCPRRGGELADEGGNRSGRAGVAIADAGEGVPASRVMRAWPG
ncbi:MAG: hypothetical protein CME06_07025 [Gemmatimonadetes bacterium]|nr:hypothetical protein [Gemmatimonadota bacterium]